MDNTCRTCRFLKYREAVEGTGLCTRFPPVIIPEKYEGGFPRVYDFWGCGEYYPLYEREE